MLAAALREPIFCPFAQWREADETRVEEHLDVTWGRHGKRARGTGRAFWNRIVTGPLLSYIGRQGAIMKPSLKIAMSAFLLAAVLVGVLHWLLPQFLLVGSLIAFD